MPRASRLLPAIALLAACRPATQITVEIATDVDCSSQVGTTIAVGEPGSVDGRPAGASTTSCSTSAPPVHDIGTIVLVPGGDGDGFGLNVVLGVDRPPEDCFAADYDGCIVARRAMSFVPHTELYLPVSLSERCKGIACDPDSTCVDGGCVDATIRDPELCTTEGACDEGSLGGAGPGAGGAGGAGGSGGGGGGAGGAPPVTCGGPGVLVDDFSTPATGPGWVVEGTGATVSESGGVLTLAPLSTGLQNFVAYRSRHAVDPTGRAVRVRVDAVAQASGQQTSLQLGFGDGTGAWIAFKGGALTMSLFDGAQQIGNPLPLPYDANEHRYWQLREQDGTLSWETSPDGIAWTARRSDAMPSFLRPAYMYIRTGASPGAQTTQAVFDDFNVGVAAEPWCPISTLHDSFDDGVFMPAWWPSTQDGGCSAKEAGGVVSMSAPMAGGTCKHRSSSAFDLRQSEIVFELSSFPSSQSNAVAFLELLDDEGTLVSVQKQGPFIGYSISGQSNATADFDPTWSRWRIRHTADQLFVAGSVDGVTWVDFVQTIAYLSNMDAVEVAFGMATASPRSGSFAVAAINP